MQKIIALLHRHALPLAALCVALVCALVAAWCGYDLSQRVDNEPVFEIINDDYSQTIAIPAAGLSQQLDLAAGQEIYGIRLNMATYDYAFQSGEVTVQGYASGEQVCCGRLSLIGMKDNTFAAVIFDAPYIAAQQQTLTLLITYSAPDPADAGRALGIWASEKQVGDMTLGTGAQPLDATAAMQLVIDYSGSWSRTLSLILGILIFAAVTLGFMLLFIRRAGIAAVVLCGGLQLGAAFAVLTPPLVAPDEYTHLANSYQQASALLGQPVSAEVDGDSYLLVRECDAPCFGTATGDIGIFAYKQYLSGLGESGCAGATTEISGAALNTGILNTTLYWGQTLGIALARLLGLGFFGMLLLGRLGNLLLYLALAVLAVSLAPKSTRGVLGCAALLPMTLQLAGSLSADAMVLGLMFCYTALCFKLRAQRCNALQAAALVLLAAMIGPAKAIYLPAALLILIIPAKNLDPRKAPKAERLALAPGIRLLPGTLVKAAALGSAVLAWVNVNLSAAIYATRDVDNVGLTRGAVAVATAAVVLLLVYYKIRRNQRYKKIFYGGIAALACVAVPVIIYRLTHMWGGLTPEQLVGSIQPNGDSIYTYSAGYICRNLPATVKLILRSISAQGAQWLQQLLGTALGEPIVYPVYASWLLGVGLVLALIYAALPVQNRPHAPMGRRAALGSGFILLCVAALTLFVALNWTPINYTVIFGVQGRYLLPVLPLCLLLAGNLRGVTAQKSTASRAVFAMLCLTSFVILQGAGIYANWQMQ